MLATRQCTYTIHLIWLQVYPGKVQGLRLPPQMHKLQLIHQVNTLYADTHTSSSGHMLDFQYRYKTGMSLVMLQVQLGWSP